MWCGLRCCEGVGGRRHDRSAGPEVSQCCRGENVQGLHAYSLAACRSVRADAVHGAADAPRQLHVLGHCTQQRRAGRGRGSGEVALAASLHVALRSPHAG